MAVAVGPVALSVALLATLALFPAQSLQLPRPQWNPAQNWEALIISRNGPLTTTTPRPSTTWTTTTLRSFGIAPLTGTGKVTIEEASLGRPQAPPQRTRPAASAASPISAATAALLLPALALVRLA